LNPSRETRQVDLNDQAHADLEAEIDVQVHESDREMGHIIVAVQAGACDFKAFVLGSELE
jgi:hypothetical protein